MGTSVLNAENRELNLSRGELNKRRKAGQVPAVVFGKEIESIPVFVDLLTFQRVYADQGKIFELNVSGTTHMVNTKKIEMNIFGNLVNHINFHKLKAGQTTTVNIPVSLVGESKGDKAGGIISTNLEVLPVTGLPKDMPEKIEIDITELEIDGKITIGEIKLAGKLTIEGEAEAIVVSCAAPKVKEEAPAGDAASEGGDAPAAEAAPVEGEAKSEE